MDFDEYETLPTDNFLVHMSAGALAGVLEHCIMYPVDLVKTRMQSLTPQVNYGGISDTLKVVVRQEGVIRLLRGMNVVAVGAGPAHALYFSCYEHLKERLQAKTTKPLYYAAGPSAVVATFLHDAVMTPTEVVKQRLQMSNSPYKSVFDCIKKTYHSEGMRAFYRSYFTQIAMNVPFQSIHFLLYEFCQNLMNEDRSYRPGVHMISGAIAGAFAAAATTPLDVIKTLINTQQHRVRGMITAFKTVYRVSGPSGYFKGIMPRVLYQMPSTAICWSFYELLKYRLSRQVVEVEGNDSASTPKISKPNGKIPNVEGLLFIESAAEEKEEYASNRSKGMKTNNNNNDSNNNNSEDKIVDEVVEANGVENKSGSLVDEIGRTYTDGKWNNTVLSRTQVMGSLKMNSIAHGEEHDPQSDLMKGTRN